MSVHKRGKTYFVRYRDDAGKQHNKHFGPGAKAKRLAEEFDLEIKLARKRKQEIVLLKGSVMHLDELFELYIRDYELSGKSLEQSRNLKWMFKSKILPKLPNKEVDKLQYKDMLDLIDCYPDLSQIAKNRYFAYLRAVFNWGIRHDYTSVNPLQKWKMGKEKPRRFVISETELSNLLKYCPPHLKLAIQITFYLGLRPGKSELFALKWDDVDFERQEVSIYATKTNQRRTIPIPDAFLPVLKRARSKAQSEFVVEYNGRQVLRVSHSLAHALEKAGINKSFRLYDLRHMYATYMLNNGGDLAAVSAMLGHSDVSLTANTYYQAMSKEKQRSANLLPKLHEDGDPVERHMRRKEMENQGMEPKKKRKKHKIKTVGYKISE